LSDEISNCSAVERLSDSAGASRSRASNSTQRQSEILDRLEDFRFRMFVDGISSLSDYGVTEALGPSKIASYPLQTFDANRPPDLVAGSCVLAIGE